MRRKVAGVLTLAQTSLRHLSRTPAWVSAISIARWLYLTRWAQRLQTLDGERQEVSKNTVAHNLTALSVKSIEAFAGERPDRLLRIVSVIETVEPERDRILFVGPRADSELLLARGYGFRKENIRGLDLISYSSQVDLGDMHDMPYDDDSWDVVILGWVLAYSNDFKKACEEVVRVARTGAIVAVGVQYHPLTPLEIAEQIGYVPGALTRIGTTEELFDLFGDSVDTVYFRHDPAAERRDRPGDILAVFSVNA